MSRFTRVNKSFKITLLLIPATPVKIKSNIMGMSSLDRIVSTGQLLGGMPDSGTPFVWRKPDGTVVETARAGGLEGLQDSLDRMEARAKTDPDASQSLSFHKQRGDLIRHALGEAASVTEQNQFAQHTKTFITDMEGFSRLVSSDPEKAYQLFKRSLHAEVAQLLQDMKPYKILRNSATLNFEDSLSQQKQISESALVRHMTPTGAILASYDPPYYRNWGRDASIVLHEMLLDKPLSPAREALFDQHLNYDKIFRDHNRALNFPGGLGEARTNIYGYMPTGPWGSPQFDSPALKVIAFSKYGSLLLQKGEAARVSAQVYPAVKEYLDYLIQVDNQPCFDPWEEIRAERHFWTEMTKAVAFQKGSELADALGEKQDALKYQQWSGNIVNNSLDKFFFQDKKDRIIFPHLNVLNPGSASKHSILDAQVLGGLLLGKEIGYPIPLDHPFALHTLTAILDAFKNIYPINQNATSPTVAVGRYPDDVYGGPDAMGKGGNPWIITTLWTGRYFYELAGKYVKEGTIDLSNGRKDDLEKLVGFSLPNAASLPASDPAFGAVVKKLAQRGDGVLQWTLDHTRDGWMSEQIDRHTGQPCSVVDLAWSHAAFLETLRSKDELDHALAGGNLQTRRSPFSSNTTSTQRSLEDYFTSKAS